MKQARAVLAAALAAFAAGCFLLAPYPDLADDVTPDAAEAGTGDAPFDSDPKGDGPVASDADAGPPCPFGPKIERCETAFDESCDGIGACTGIHRRAWRAGDTAAQNATGVAVGPDGTIYVVGVYSGHLAFDGPTPDAGALAQSGATNIPDGFVVALDPKTFAVKWALGIPDGPIAGISVGKKGLAIAGNAFADIAIGTCPVLAHAGVTTPDVFVATLDHDLTCRKAKIFGDAADQRTIGVALDDESGEVAVAGDTNGTIDFGGATTTLTPGTGAEAFVARLDADLDGLRAVRLASRNAARISATAVAVGRSPGNNAKLTTLVGSIASGGSDVECLAVQPPPVGFGTIYCKGPTEAFAITLNETTAGGQRQWGGPDGGAKATAVAHVEGDLVVAGTFGGTVSFGGPSTLTATDPFGDVFLFRTPYGSSNTDHTQAHFGGSGIESVYAIAGDSAGNLVIAGEYQGQPSFGGPALPSASVPTAFVAKTRGTGTGTTTAFVHQWSHAYTSEQPTAAHALATGALGQVYVAGKFLGAMSFGGSKTLDSNGSTTSDVFVFERAP